MKPQNVRHTKPEPNYQGKMKKRTNLCAAVFFNLLFSSGLVLVGLTFARKACANEPLDFGGQVFSNVYLPTHDSPQTKIQQTQIASWINLIWPVHESLTGKLDALVFDNLNSQIVRSDGISTLGAHVSLREASIENHTNSWRSRWGVIYKPWGKSDGINPTDYFALKDESILGLDEEIKKLGQLGTWIQYIPHQGDSRWSFEFRWSIDQHTSYSGLAASDLSTSYKLVKNNDTPRNSFAVRAAWTGDGWDGDIIAFHGTLARGILTEQRRLSIVAPYTELALTREPVSAAGGNLSFAIQDFLIRIEASRVWSQNDLSGVPLHNLSRFEGVVGVEKSYLERFRAQIQTVVNHYDSLQAQQSIDLVDSLIQAQNELLLETKLQTQVFESIRLSYENTLSDWSGEVMMMTALNAAPSFVLRPKIQYTPKPNLKLTSGLDYLGGAKDRQLGSQTSRRNFTFEVKYIF